MQRSLSLELKQLPAFWCGTIATNHSLLHKSMRLAAIHEGWIYNVTLFKNALTAEEAVDSYRVGISSGCETSSPVDPEVHNGPHRSGRTSTYPEWLLTAQSSGVM